MKFRGLMLIIMAAYMVAGCSTAQIQAMDEAGGVGVLTDEKDQFDGMRRIRMSPAWLSKTGDTGFNWTAPYKIGAQWLQQAPDRVMLIVELAGEIENISGIGINVAGNVTRYEIVGRTQFDVDTGNRWIPTESIAYVDMPLNDLIDIVKANDVQMRMYLLSGEFSDADFGALKGTGGALTARYYLSNKFIPRVLGVTPL